MIGYERESPLLERKKELELKYSARKSELEEQIQAMDQEKRKQNGAFFTPFKTACWLFSVFIIPWIKKRLENGILQNGSPLRSVKVLAEFSMLEPGFGRADFLRAAFTSLKNYYDEQYRIFLSSDSFDSEKNDLMNLFLKKRDLFILKYNLKGIERDPLLYELGLIDLSIYAGVDILNSPQLRSNYLNCDFFDFYPSHPGSGTNKDQVYENIEKFDLIYGNPPWGAVFSPERVNQLDRYMKTVTRTSGKEMRADSFVYYSIKSLALLKPDGRLGFLVPNFLLTNPSYTGFRKLLLKYRIDSIVNLQEDLFAKVTMPSCFFTVDKVQPASDDAIRVFKQDENSKVREILYITHGTVKKSSLCRIPLAKHFYSFQNRLKMKDLLKNGRGIEIGKKGLVTVCPSCGIYRPLPKNEGKYLCTDCRKEFDSISHKKSIIHDLWEKKCSHPSHPLIIGAQIKRFYFEEPNRYIIETGLKGINYKYHLMHAPKILIRKTGSGINAAVDTQGFYAVQVVYILYFPDFKTHYKGYSLDYINALLNSTTMSDLYFSRFSDPGKSRFPHLIQRNLLELPVPEISVSLMEQIEKAVKSIKHSPKEVYERRLEEIDNLMDIAFQS